jgi:hypothetical protein
VSGAIGIPAAVVVRSAAAPALAAGSGQAQAWHLSLGENVGIYVGIPAGVLAGIAVVVFTVVSLTGSVDSRSIRVARLQGPRVRTEPVLGRPTDAEQHARGQPARRLTDEHSAPADEDGQTSGGPTTTENTENTKATEDGEDGEDGEIGGGSMPTARATAAGETPAAGTGAAGPRGGQQE